MINISDISNNITLKQKSEIEHIFKNKFKIENLIFFDSLKNYIEIINSLERFKNKMNNIPKLIIQSRDFFSAIGDDVFDIDFIEIREKYRNEFGETLNLFKKEFSKSTDSDLKRAIYFGFKNYKENLIEKYLEEVKK